MTSHLRTRRPGFWLGARTTSGLVAVALCGLVIASCETLPGGGGGRAIPAEEARRDFKPDDASYAKLGFRRDWTGFPHVARARQPVRFIDVAEDLVIVQDTRNTITALNGGNGSQRWATTIANPLTRFHGLIRESGQVHGAAEAEVFTLDLATGTLTSRQQFDRLASSMPVLVGDTMVYGTGDGRVLGHNLTLNVGAGGNTIDGSVRVPVAIVGDAVGVVSDSGSVMFLDAGTLRLISRSSMYRGSVSAPIAGDSMMFVASLDQSIYAFAQGASRPVWSYLTQSPLRSQPVHADGVVYCDIPGEGMVAFEAYSGRKIWTQKGVGGTIIGRNKGRLIAWDGQTATTLDPATGDIIDRVTLPNLTHVLMDRFDGGNLYVVTNKGAVGKFTVSY